MLSQPQPNFADNFGPFLSAGPSPELERAIEAAAIGRPVYHLGRAHGVVPALKWTAEWARHHSDPGALLHLPAAACLDGGAANNAAAELLHASPRALTQFRRLVATTATDIGGAGRRAIAVTLHGDEESVRQADRDREVGRELWIGLGAWPWWAIAAAYIDNDEPLAPGLKGGLPNKWWELPRVEQTLAAWLR